MGRTTQGPTVHNRKKWERRRRRENERRRTNHMKRNRTRRTKKGDHLHAMVYHKWPHKLRLRRMGGCGHA